MSTMIEGNLPDEWYDRASFAARKFLLFQWIVFSLVMTCVYGYDYFKLDKNNSNSRLGIPLK